MKRPIDNSRNIRKSTLSLIEGLTTEQLNKIPESFSNNIIWNLAHMAAVQQILCYRRSGLPTPVYEAFVDLYKPGTTPGGYVEQKYIDDIKAQFLSSLYKLEEDYNNGIFKDYPAFTTRYGVELTSIEEAIEFLLFHDGFHMGYILALKRVV